MNACSCLLLSFLALRVGHCPLFQSLQGQEGSKLVKLLRNYVRVSASQWAIAALINFCLLMRRTHTGCTLLRHSLVVLLFENLTGGWHVSSVLITPSLSPHRRVIAPSPNDPLAKHSYSLSSRRTLSLHPSCVVPGSSLSALSITRAWQVVEYTIWGWFVLSSVAPPTLFRQRMDRYDPLHILRRNFLMSHQVGNY